MANSTITEFSACCWSTLSLARTEIEAVQSSVAAMHAGAAIVESCQRTEAYSLSLCDCPAPLHFRGADALFHLAEVAAGLHSVVLGEAQILGQARRGFAAAQGELRRRADIAFAAARDLRRETNFNSHAGALLDRGLRVAGRKPGGRLLVLGAGQMGRLVAERGRHLGFAEVVVAARRPHDLGGQFGYVPLDSLTLHSRRAELPGFDVIAGCLGSGADAIGPGGLPPASLLLDLGTPRNFAGVYAGKAVSLADLMGEEEKRPHAVRRRRALRKAIRGRVESALLDGRHDAASPVGQLRAEVEAIRRRELERMTRLHPEIAPQTLDILTHSLVNQLFHAPSERLKSTDDPQFGRRVAALFAQI